MASLTRLASRIVGVANAKRLRFWLVRAKEVLGRRHYPAHHLLDLRLIDILGGRPGVFVEAGANDGLNQSNTWALERYHGWSGLLVEPVPEVAALCRSFRRSPCAGVALGSFERDGGFLDLYTGGLMTVAAEVDPARLKGLTAVEHAGQGARFTGADTKSIRVPVRALSRLLDEYGIGAVDLLSLDVEGYEREVFAGVDFARHAPKHILVETEDPAGIAVLLGARYGAPEKLSPHDYLFALRT